MINNPFIPLVSSGVGEYFNESIEKQIEFDNLSEHDKKLYKIAKKVTTHVLHPFEYVFMRIKYIDSINPNILKKSSIDIVRYI